MRSMTCSDLKKFLPRLPRRKTILVGLAVWVCAVLLLLWQAEQVALVQIIITVSVGGLGLNVALRQLRATEKSTSVAQNNVRVAQEGQITERFTKAIEHLGSDKIEIRLGGISALERIAKDSEKDHGPIMEVLTAHVREKAPRQEEDTPKAADTPATDIQAILTVIGRRETTGKGRRNASLNLRKTHLVGADLHNANMAGVVLAGADLDWADLSEAENLTAKQVRSARNWRTAYLPDYLAHLKNLPD